jgi:hypothetical protein
LKSGYQTGSRVETRRFQALRVNCLQLVHSPSPSAAQSPAPLPRRRPPWAQSRPPPWRTACSRSGRGCPRRTSRCSWSGVERERERGRCVVLCWVSRLWAIRFVVAALCFGCGRGTMRYAGAAIGDEGKCRDAMRCKRREHRCFFRFGRSTTRIKRWCRLSTRRLNSRCGREENQKKNPKNQKECQKILPKDL